MKVSILTEGGAVHPGQNLVVTDPSLSRVPPPTLSSSRVPLVINQTPPLLVIINLGGHRRRFPHFLAYSGLPPRPPPTRRHSPPGIRRPLRRRQARARRPFRRHVPPAAANSKSRRQICHTRGRRRSPPPGRCVPRSPPAPGGSSGRRSAAAESVSWPPALRSKCQICF